MPILPQPPAGVTTPPAPYYSDEFVTLYHGDCLTFDDWLEADVLVTDPPYGRDWRSGSGMTNAEGRGRGSKPHSGIANDKDTTTRDAALAMWNGLAVVFGDPLVAPPTSTRQALVYAKPIDAGIKGAHAGFRRDAEMIYLVGDWWVGVGGRSSVMRTNALVAGPRGLSVRYGHPHAKPVDLLSTLIGITGDGCAITDPFAGSGSTLVAAKQMKRRVIGVELEERYCEIAALRLSQDILDFGEASA